MRWVRWTVGWLWLITSAGACDQAVDPGHGDGGTRTVEVVLAPDRVPVDLGDLATVDVDGQPRVRVSDVVAAAFPAAADLAADFAGVDGFRPASKVGCRPLIPVPADHLAGGTLDPATANLVWDPAFGYSGCLHISQVGEVILISPDDPRPAVRVVLGEASAEVELPFQPTVEVAGEAVVPLQTVVRASGVTDSPDGYEIDLEDDAGLRPAAGGGLDPLAFDALAEAFVRPGDRGLVWRTAPAAAAWDLGTLQAVYLVDPGGLARQVSVVLGESQAMVDLGALPREPVGSESLVPLQAVVQAAELTATPESLGYDFEGSDGFRPMVDRGLLPLTWAQLALGWIHPVTANLTWDASLGLPGTWRVVEVARVHLLP